MLYSRMLIPTLREVPSDAEITSHQLMLRSGMIRKQVAGLYTFLPLGLRILQKIEHIVREEMNKAGALEIRPPFVTPADLWKESGRYEAYGKELLRFKDRHDNELLLGPTHEEAFTSIVRDNVQSYRDLPLNLYQINTKFRDEIRPRFGVMRSREFIMKDAYSFDIDEKGLDRSYQDMRASYRNIFKRCGLDVDPVQADTGAMGGSNSEEFMVPSSVGEEEIVKCSHCDYVANVERAVCHTEYAAGDEALQRTKEVDTPNVKTIEELTRFFNIGADKFIKSLIYVVDQNPVMALIRGDKEINEIKLKNLLGASEVELAPEELVREVTGAPVGFAGPVGIKDKIKGIKIVADDSVTHMVNSYTGANKKDKHLKGVNIKHDFVPDVSGDIQLVQAGDLCPECKHELNSYRGIEVGHIFKLGYKYTEKMNVTFLDKDGKEKHPIMGCYGIGVARTMASIMEQAHDDFGVIWPITVAPFHILILPINVTDEAVMKAAQDLHDNLSKKYEVLLDDRDERAGVKFNDADLIGIPIRITLGKAFTAEQKVEVKLRDSKDKELVDLSAIEKYAGELYDKEMAKYQI